MLHDAKNGNASPSELARLAATDLQTRLNCQKFDVAVVLGSGWSAAAETLGKIVGEVPARTVRGFESTPVPGHNSAIWAIRIPSSKKVALVFGSRNHFYDTKDADIVAHPVRTAGFLGVKEIVLTNGAGAVNPQLTPGQIVLIADQINLTGATPLRGPDFVDLTEAYSVRLRRLAREVDPSLPQGVYAQFSGPQYETPAEIRMAESFGADLVGMSTALETIAARSIGMDVLGLSLVTNLAAGISPAALSHEDVLAAGQRAAPKLSAVLAQVVARIGQA